MEKESKGIFFPFLHEIKNHNVEGEIKKLLENYTDEPTLGNFILLSIKLSDILLNNIDNDMDRSIALLIKILSSSSYDSLSEDDKKLILEDTSLHKIFSYSQEFVGYLENYSNDKQLIKFFKDSVIKYLKQNKISKNEVAKFIKTFNSKLIHELGNNDTYLKSFCVVNKIKAFVSLPFSKDFFEIRNLINEILQRYGITIIDLYNDTDSKNNLNNTITDLLKKSNLMIADVTGLNSSVIYEIGYSRALNKQIILLIEDSSNTIPHFLKGDMFLVYNKSYPDKLKKYLELSLKNFILKEILW